MTIKDCVEVEIIGWLYQFYISAKKDEVFASKIAVKKEDIPAATQLFTPRWIVEYMVQNTVGKLWLQNKPNSNLKEYMPYFIDSTSATTQEYLKIKSVEEIKLLDQACGSGHILVYGFELFYKIYEEEGFNPNEIPELIIKNNLFGFEIDDRAAQLAAMALMLKARGYNRRVFKKEIEPHILCYKDLKLSISEIRDTFQKIGIEFSEKLSYDLTNMQNATNYGSLIAPHSTVNELEKVLYAIKNENTSDAFFKRSLEQLATALQQLILLGNKYHSVVDNPPYMGEGKMNKALGDFVKLNYPNSKADLMTCFMEAGLKMTLKNGKLGMINLPSWLFIAAFSKLRNSLLSIYHIDSLLHMGRGIFGVDWGSTAFVISNAKAEDEGFYFKLHKRNFQHLHVDDIKSIFLQSQKNKNIKINFDAYREDNTLNKIPNLIDENGEKIVYQLNQDKFLKIPGNNIAYWLSSSIIDNFEKSTIDDFGTAKAGIVTGNDIDFIKSWHEISINKIRFNETEYKRSKDIIWVPINKGGDFRKYYGNFEHVVNIYNLWSEGRTTASVRRGSKENYFKKGVSWSYVSSVKSSFRISENTVFATASPVIFFTESSFENYILGLLNSKVSEIVINALNPTLNLVSGDVLRVPVILNSAKKAIIDSLVKNVTDISTIEWNNRETSWDFKRNELIRINGQDLEESFDLYQLYWKKKFFQLHENEEEINKLFIEIYGLKEELTPDVAFEDITILREETEIQNGQLNFKPDEVFKQFISYGVGCMFGRYSLDKDSLIIADHSETVESYLLKIGKEKSEILFLPDEDNIIPILDDEWFEDDITARFYTFLKASFGIANFDKNLAFLEECLGKDIRKYFVKDFYADHIKRYKKRPIYWMISSPKGSFNVLIYMHRYTPDTLNDILNNYLIEYREKLNNRIEHLDHLIVTGTSLEQTKAQKEKDKLKLILIELLEYEREVLRPLAIERIKIDLDDGVLVNYNKFGKAIKEVAGLNDKATKKKIKEFDWINVEEIR